MVQKALDSLFLIFFALVFDCAMSLSRRAQRAR